MRLLVHVAPVRNDKDCVILLLLAFKDITFPKPPIEEPQEKNGTGRRRPFVAEVAYNKNQAFSHEESLEV